MYILVIDVGTSSIRGVLFGAAGEPLFVHQIPYQPDFLDGGWVEQDPSDWSDTLVEIGQRTATFCREQGIGVDALSLTCQRSSIIPVDERGSPLRRAIMWQDKRNASIVLELKPREAEIHTRTGARVNTVFSGSKMTWFRRNQPKVYQKTHKICTIADYITHQITGQFCTDHTYGSRSLLMNIRTRTWEWELLDLFEVEEEKLCELVQPGSIIGTVTAAFAQQTGLPEGIPLISAGGDQQCAALGHGVTGPGTLEITTGTGAFLLGYCAQVPEQLGSGVICGAHAIPERYVLETSMLTCAALYNWGKRTLFSEEPSEMYETINRGVTLSPPGARGCIALPYFQGRGTPDWNANATGAFLGLTLGTTREDMARALLEGIACEAGNNLEELERYTGPMEQIYVGGGLTKFPTFNQIQADVYQKPLLRCADQGEQTALGAWASAAVTLGLYRDYEQALTTQREEQSYEHYQPNPQYRALYQEQRARMNRIYQALSC